MPGVFICATRQHVGKTSSSLGLVYGLQKIFNGNVGFIKPVGQQHVFLPAYGDRGEDGGEDGAGGAGGAGGRAASGPASPSGAATHNARDHPNTHAHHRATATSGTASSSTTSAPPAPLIPVDKDCPLFKEFLDCRGSYADMSPIIVPSGFTKDFLSLDHHDREERREENMGTIVSAYERIEAGSDFVVAEGTGHSAVGSVVGLSNAAVAARLDIPMIMVVNGGIGSTLDEFHLNRALIERDGARLCGVLVNKVAPKKLEQVTDYLELALGREGVPLLAVIPDKEFFESPTMADFEQLFNTELLRPSAGGSSSSSSSSRGGVLTTPPLQQHQDAKRDAQRSEFLGRHFSETRLATSSVSHFLATFNASPRDTLWVMHASRTDLILALKAAAQEVAYKDRHSESGGAYPGGLILTGRPNVNFPRGMQEEIYDIAVNTLNLPCMYVPKSSHKVMEAIDRFTAKLNTRDPDRAVGVMQHYAEHIDFELLLERAHGNDGAMRSFGCPR
jgi:BioD-like phosphotransacetylase family protein